MLGGCFAADGPGSLIKMDGIDISRDFFSPNSGYLCQEVNELALDGYFDKIMNINIPTNQCKNGGWTTKN